MSTAAWRLRSADITKAPYREAVPQNTASNIQTPRNNREITAQQKCKQK